MTGVYVLLAICAVLAAASLTVSLVQYKRGKKSAENVDADKLAADVSNTLKQENGMITGAINTLSGSVGSQAQATRDLMTRFDTFIVNVDRQLGEVKSDNTKNLAMVREESTRALDAVRKDNAEQLEKMRQTVDEKLTSTIDQRFNESFKLVGARLQEINVTFNALQGLQNDVNDLNKIFKNVKTRGTWGEVSLENLLSQVLTPDQYIKQAAISRGDSEEGRVDFAIKLPGKGDGTVLLPIDAKFPLEDYQRLIDASVEGDQAKTEQSVKALCDAILKQGRSIRDKYIKTPKTTDFAIMYLPVEGLYSEVVKRTDLLEKLQNDCKVVACGPTTLSALLNSLRMGFRSVAIEQRSKEIAKLLGQFQKDFGIFSKYLTLLKKRMNTVQGTIEDAEKKSNSIGTKLSKVTRIDVGGDEVDLLEGVSPSSLDEEEESILSELSGDDDEG